MDTEYGMRKMKKMAMHRWFVSGRFVSGLLIIIFLLAQSQVASALSNGIYAETSKNSRAGKITSSIAVEDTEGALVPLGKERDSKSVAANLLAATSPGQAGAEKSALFLNSADASDGIVKNVDDLVYASAVEDMDVIFVLDVSASMESTFPDGNAGIQSRISVARQSIMLQASKMLSLNQSNRIAIVTFSSTAGSYLDFGTDTNTIDQVLPYQADGAGTNYEAGLDQAKKLLDGRGDTQRKSIVVLITDGQPNEGDYLSGAEEIKNEANSELYCIGIQSGAANILGSMATDANHYMDCATAKDFSDYMDTQTAFSVTGKAVSLEEKIPDGFSMICNAEHPVSFNGTEYTSMQALPSGDISISEDHKTIRWNISALDGQGIRVSYYTKMSDGLLFSTGSENKTYQTCEESILSYENQETAGGASQVSVRLKIPSIRVEIKVAAAEEQNSEQNTKPQVQETDKAFFAQPKSSANQGSASAKKQDPQLGSTVKKTAENKISKLEPIESGTVGTENKKMMRDRNVWTALATILSAVLALQLFSIISDIRVIKWYGAKKRAFLDGQKKQIPITEHGQDRK